MVLSQARPGSSVLPDLLGSVTTHSFTQTETWDFCLLLTLHQVLLVFLLKLSQGLALSLPPCPIALDCPSLAHLQLPCPLMGLQGEVEAVGCFSLPLGSEALGCDFPRSCSVPASSSALRFLQFQVLSSTCMESDLCTTLSTRLAHSLFIL